MHTLLYLDAFASSCIRGALASSFKSEGLYIISTPNFFPPIIISIHNDSVFLSVFIVVFT